MISASEHQHPHNPNRFAVIPTPERLNAVSSYTGRGVTIAFLDSGFYPHPDLVSPTNRVAAYEDISGEYPSLESESASESWQWHGTQTTVAAAGNGSLSSGTYRGLASEARLVLVKVSQSGRITEDNIAKGIRWIIENRQRYNIRVLNISLGGDEDIPCSKSEIDQAAEQAIREGIVVIVAAGNSGQEGKHSLPPANSPSVITVGGYTDDNRLDARLDLYQSNFGFTADGTLKPEVVAPAMWVAAPILPGTINYRRAEALSQLAGCFDYELVALARKLAAPAELPKSVLSADAATIRTFVETVLREQKIVAAHYQHVDGTSFAAPIVSSIAAQMLEANPQLTPAAVKNILITTAERINGLSLIRQGYGVVNARRAIEAALVETHDLTPLGCESLKLSDGKVRFAYHNDTAQSVALAGDFNNWDGTASKMMKDQKGLWTIDVGALAPGRYQYKFIIDGRDWVEDPDNGLKAPNNFGGLNSVLLIES